MSQVMSQKVQIPLPQPIPSPDYYTLNSQDLQVLFIVLFWTEMVVTCVGGDVHDVHRYLSWGGEQNI